MERIFEYEGILYSFDANACYDGPGLIKLPSGKILHVGAWLEVYPPKPMGLTTVEFLPGTEPEATPAFFTQETKS